MSARGTRPGRRPGSSSTRQEILAAARVEFARNGFDRTTIRAVASAARVDPALVHHYFGTKRGLFTASLEVPVDPSEVIAPVLELPVGDIGPALLRTVLGAWESPLRPTLAAAFRATVTESDGALLRTFLLEFVLRDLVPLVDEPAGSGRVRVQLVASQIAGLLLTRYVLTLEPLASLPVDDVVAVVGPTVQRYLTGDWGRDLTGSASSGIR
ncbi:TetR/AcrR family transcriptional regulator [Rhodococcus triatomae]|uniref:Regulatory protein, tetR family n=1 Tax=Rhodococcus triatomae TaxID=300028 RepID=A0A1G8CEM9_9NOCA|nr:TetR family transcriptional regulator [Rhodococcus triatomae]QNG18669.1 TetR/AcrR family transcriptional regulator [Rhodococcus triatomae]QNG21661.1 TetR/AcrR family transcriptional regulator [Rhodococcus triatomae]SDH43944.1 regulatory protein, tetR family [Rhodococcus triatomae]